MRSSGNIGARIQFVASGVSSQADFVQLKRGFKFRESETILRDLQSALTGERAQYATRVTSALAALRQLRNLGARELADLRSGLEEVRRKCETASRVPALSELGPIHALLPSIDEGDERRLASEAIKQLQLAAQTLDQICLAVVDRAGRG